MGDGTAQFLGGDFFVGHGLDHFGTGHEHVELSLTMKMKSVIDGLYTAPPAQGPIIMEICGTTRRP